MSPAGIQALQQQLKSVRELLGHTEARVDFLRRDLVDAESSLLNLSMCHAQLLEDLRMANAPEEPEYD